MQTLSWDQSHDSDFSQLQPATFELFTAKSAKVDGDRHSVSEHS